MNLLLEIGSEEIPDWMIGGALEYLGAAITELVKSNQLGEVAVRTDGTPRRLVVRGQGVIARQPDTEERVWGPAKNAPAPAVAGFAKKQGLTPEQLEILSDGKAEKYSCVRRTAGRSAAAILAENFPSLILKTPFPKTMYWTGKGGVRFIRPIRWMTRSFRSRSRGFSQETNPAATGSWGARASR